MVEVVEEEIKVRTQTVFFLWGRLWKAVVVFCVECRRDASEHPTDRETSENVSEVQRATKRCVTYSNSLWANIDDGS